MAGQFNRRCAEAAAAIRAGSLRQPPDVSQVSARSYEPLARMNELGFLTIDSQEGQTDERAYVSGFLPAARAHALAEALNCGGDKVGIVLQPCAKEARSRVALTRDRHGRASTNMPLYMRTSLYEQLRAQALPRGGPDVLLVECFDPRWGRRAFAKRGLFADVLAALDGSAENTRVEQQ